MNSASGDSALPGAQRDDLAMSLRRLRASSNPSAADPEISHLVRIDEWLSGDPASYFRWVADIGRNRLRSQQSSAALAAAVASLSRRLRDARIAPFVCGEALQICLSDLVLLEELEESDLPLSAVATLRRDLVPASIDLVRRVMRNLTLSFRRGDAIGSQGPGKVLRLSEFAAGAPVPPSRFDRDKPVLVIPTAGRGTRLRSTIPKGLVPVGGVPMIKRAIRAADEAGVNQKIFVLKYRADVQQEYLSRYGHIVVQTAADGNGHSAYAGLSALPGQRAPVLISYSDCPFLSVGTFRRLMAQPMGLREAFRLSTYTPAREGAGRIVRDAMGEIDRIDQPRIINVSQYEGDGGLYEVSHQSFYAGLGGITNNNVRGEYMITDAIRQLRATNLRTTGVPGPSQDFQSVDVPADLIMAKLRVATGAYTAEHFADPQLAAQILAFFSSYGLRIPPAERHVSAEGPGTFPDLAIKAVASARALVGPLLHLEGAQ